VLVDAIALPMTHIVRGSKDNGKLAISGVFFQLLDYRFPFRGELI
jgi:hypothetical protein